MSFPEQSAELELVSKPSFFEPPLASKPDFFEPQPKLSDPTFNELTSLVQGAVRGIETDVIKVLVLATAAITYRAGAALAPSLRTIPVAVLGGGSIGAFGAMLLFGHDVPTPTMSRPKVFSSHAEPKPSRMENLLSRARKHPLGAFGVVCATALLDRLFVMFGVHAFLADFMSERTGWFVAEVLPHIRRIVLLPAPAAPSVSTTATESNVALRLKLALPFRLAYQFITQAWLSGQVIQVRRDAKQQQQAWAAIVGAASNGLDGMSSPVRRWFWTRAWPVLEETDVIWSVGSAFVVCRAAMLKAFRRAGFAGRPLLAWMAPWARKLLLLRR